MIIEKLHNYIKNHSKWFWYSILLTFVIDGINSSLSDKIQSYFYIVLEGKNTKSIFSLIVIYSFFIILLVFIGMMSSYENKPYLSKKQKFYKKLSEYFSVMMIAGYGIILLMPALNILGMGDSNSNFSDNQQYTYFMILTALFLTLMIFGFLKFKTHFIFGKANYFYVYIPILILSTLFIDFSSALWRFQLYDPNIIVDPNRGSKLIEFIVIFPLYAIFYSAPRFVLLRKSYTILPIISALFSTAYFVWKSLNYIEL